MTKSKDRSKQLQLRLLVDVGGCTSNSTLAGKEKECAAIGSKLVSMALPASENDMSVYRQMSGNYFRSLRKI